MAKGFGNPWKTLTLVRGQGLPLVYAMGFSFIQIYFYNYYCYIIYIWSTSTALPVDEMLIYRLMQYLLLHRMIIQWFGSNSALSCFLVFSSVVFFFFCTDLLSLILYTVNSPTCHRDVDLPGYSTYRSIECFSSKSVLSYFIVFSSSRLLPRKEYKTQWVDTSIWE